MQNNQIAVLKLFIDNLNKNTFGADSRRSISSLNLVGSWSWIHRSSNVQLTTYF